MLFVTVLKINIYLSETTQIIRNQIRKTKILNNTLKKAKIKLHKKQFCMVFSKKSTVFMNMHCRI
jgi:hypothetical protein